jgi:hypothetical protein
MKLRRKVFLAGPRLSSHRWCCEDSNHRATQLETFGNGSPGYSGAAGANPAKPTMGDGATPNQT